MTPCDVLIVGGGPAGSACACRLRSSGLDVLILDRKTFPRDKPCAGAIGERGDKLLRELGISVEADQSEAPAT